MELQINVNKCTILSTNDIQNVNITINGRNLEKANQFNYRDSTLYEIWGSEKDIKHRKHRQHLICTGKSIAQKK